MRSIKMCLNSPALTSIYVVYDNFIGLFITCCDEALVILVLLYKNLKQLLDLTLPSF